MNHAAIVVTDSGGIQEETTCLGVPCVTVRENTERPVTVTCGTNVIAGTQTEDIRRAVRTQRTRKFDGQVPEKWDGRAGARIIKAIGMDLRKRTAQQVSRFSKLQVQWWSSVLGQRVCCPRTGPLTK